MALEEFTTNISVDQFEDASADDLSEMESLAQQILHDVPATVSSRCVFVDPVHDAMATFRVFHPEDREQSTTTIADLSHIKKPSPPLFRQFVASESPSMRFHWPNHEALDTAYTVADSILENSSLTDGSRAVIEHMQSLILYRLMNTKTTNMQMVTDSPEDKPSYFEESVRRIISQETPGVAYIKSHSVQQGNDTIGIHNVVPHGLSPNLIAENGAALKINYYDRQLNAAHEYTRTHDGAVGMKVFNSGHPVNLEQGLEQHDVRSLIGPEPTKYSTKVLASALSQLAAK